MTIKRTRIPTELHDLSSTTIAELAILRSSGTKRITLPTIAHCMAIPELQLRIRTRLETHLSDYVGFPIKFRDDDAMRRFLLAPDLPPIVESESDLLRAVFRIEPVPSRIFLYFSPIARIFVFRDWKTYLQCVAARLRNPLPDNEKHYPDPANPRIRRGWKEVFKAAFPDHTPGDRTLQRWAAAGHRILAEHHRVLGFWLELPASDYGPRKHGPRAAWFEHIQVRPHWFEGSDFITWDPGRPEHFGYQTQFDADIRRPT